MNSADPVHLQSPFGAQTTREHHAALLSALRARDVIEIDAGWVEHVDPTFMQTPASATRTAVPSPERMRLIAVSTPPRSAPKRAGLRHSPSDDQINWV